MADVKDQAKVQRVGAGGQGFVQVTKVKDRFGIGQVVLVGDRGC